MLDENLGVSRSEVSPGHFFAMLYRSPTEKLFTSSTPQGSETAESAYRAETLGAGGDLASSCSRTLQQRRNLLLYWAWSCVFFLGDSVANHYTSIPVSADFFCIWHSLIQCGCVIFVGFMIIHNRNVFQLLKFISLEIKKGIEKSSTIAFDAAAVCL